MHIAYFPYLGTTTYYVFPIWWVYQWEPEGESPSTCYWLIPNTEQEELVGEEKGWQLINQKTED